MFGRGTRRQAERYYQALKAISDGGEDVRGREGLLAARAIREEFEERRSVDPPWWLRGDARKRWWPPDLSGDHCPTCEQSWPPVVLGAGEKVPEGVQSVTITLPEDFDGDSITLYMQPDGLRTVGR